MGGYMVDEFNNSTMSATKITLSDWTLKRVHTKVVYYSSNEESITCNVKKTKVISLKTWPRFLVIGSSDDEALKTLSRFAIQKGLQGLAQVCDEVEE